MTNQLIQAEMRALVRADLKEFSQDNRSFIDKGKHLNQRVDQGCARVDAYLATPNREAA